MKRMIIVFILAQAVIISGVFFFHNTREKMIVTTVKAYSDSSYRIERNFIENIPVYRDYATKQLVDELKKFNLAIHAVEVAKTGLKPMHNENDIMENARSGRLHELKADDGLFYFHNVKKEFRYLTPATIDGLKLVTERFQQKLQKHKDGLPQVKIAISSVIRTVDYQEKIFGRKFVSTHSFGGCFDIFFDDFFVVLPEQEGGWSAEKAVISGLRTRLGFLMGDSLREQLRTILMETLVELQREGKLYAFLEEENRCYHVTIMNK